MSALLRFVLIVGIIVLLIDGTPFELKINDNVYKVKFEIFEKDKNE